MDISSIRKDYSLKSLEIKDVNQDPLTQFKRWFEEAIRAEALEVNAMTLSTLGKDGYPNGRIVLLKGIDSGFTFFTNYQSEKGQEIEKLSKGSLTFFWPELERQVRIKGDITKITAEESDDYFFSRPYGSQVGAWTSEQSSRIESREVLNRRQSEIEQRFDNEPMQRPDNWGGYRLTPNRIEFWQGRSSRLHDRICYDLKSDKWQISRLAP
jgi:pyridoxamine 5'-phosphate oxidase